MPFKPSAFWLLCAVLGLAACSYNRSGFSPEVAGATIAASTFGSGSGTTALALGTARTGVLLDQQIRQPPQISHVKTHILQVALPQFKARMAQLAYSGFAATTWQNYQANAGLLECTIQPRWQVPAKLVAQQLVSPPSFIDNCDSAVYQCTYTLASNGQSFALSPTLAYMCASPNGQMHLYEAR